MQLPNGPSNRPLAIREKVGSRHSLVAGLVIFALCILRYWVVYDPALGFPQGYESYAIARSLAKTGEFANPFDSLKTGPSAHLAPLFPFWLSILMREFGDGSVGAYASQWSAAVAVSLLVGLFPLASTILGMGNLNGILAALLWLAAKPQTFPPWENAYAAVCVVVATCLFRRYIEVSAPSTKSIVSLGLASGFLMLLSPSCALVLIAWLAYSVWMRRANSLQTPNWLLFVVPIVVLLPWTARNYVVFHRIIPVRDNFGLELSVSNNECAAFGIRQSQRIGCFDRVHPDLNRVEAERVLALGEPAYADLRMHEAMKWISSNPGSFVRLTSKRIEAFWFPNETGSVVRVLDERGFRRERSAVYALTLLSVIGLLLLYRVDSKSAAVCLLWFGLFPVVYYFIQYEDRYRYPILWVTFLVGSLPLTRILLKILSGIGTPYLMRRPYRQ